MDVRYFRLSSYSLDAGSSYTVYSIVSVGAGSDAVKVNTSVIVRIGSGGMVAAIVGGSERRDSARSDLVLDASISYQEDYPSLMTSGLRFAWSCLQTAPTYGSACNLTAANTTLATLVVPAGRLEGSASYRFTVVVSDSAGETDTDEVSIELTDRVIPQVSISPVQTKYNPGDKIALVGSVSLLPELGAVSTWSSASLNATYLASVSLTPLSRQLTSSGSGGVALMRLALPQGALAAGVSYTFRLSAYYSNNDTSVSSFAQVVVVMNSAPVGGVVTAVPSEGIAFNTSFLLTTSSWTDDATDYPLSYMLSYFPSGPASQRVVKSIDQNSYISSTLGQGTKEHGHVVIILASAVDSYGATATTTTTAVVLPPSSNAQLLSATTTALSSALALKNPTAVAQVVGSVTPTLNNVNCTVPANCTSIHREVCSRTPQTCGQCLSGFIGFPGDSNVPCLLSSQMLPIGGGCIVGGPLKCISGLCSASTGKCIDKLKLCPNDCSNNGTCSYVDVNQNDIAACYASDVSCRAVCNCNTGLYGRDCSLALSSLTSARSVRESLCAAIYSTLSIQDVTADVVLSRATSIVDILLDPRQISTYALSNCTAALVQTVQDYPSLAGLDSTASWRLCLRCWT
jgi:hypothetical protein